MGAYFGDDAVASVSESVISAIDAATFGSGRWQDIPTVLSDLFPGSFCGMWNLNFVENRLNCHSWANINPDFAKSFADHYAYINPWTRYWAVVGDGHVALSEHVCPSSSFSGTEFYNDWLAPQPGSEAAAGMKLVGGQGEVIQVVLHFPLSLSPLYDKPSVEVLGRIAGALRRHIAFTRHLRQGIERSVTSAALVKRSRCAAFVMDGNRRVCEANALAEQLFAKFSVVTIRNNRCVLGNAEADARLGAVLDKRCRGLPSQGVRISVRTDTSAWQLLVAPLPAGASSEVSGMLLPPRQLFLILATEMNASSAGAADLSTLKAMFGLTPSEIAFCHSLLSGLSIAEAADQLEIATETARDRVKSIFSKTGTSRQGQLLLLLSRLL
jgi:DNA-binding CsgD family transcriptional regulator